MDSQSSPLRGSLRGSSKFFINIKNHPHLHHGIIVIYIEANTTILIASRRREAHLNITTILGGRCNNATSSNKAGGRCNNATSSNQGTEPEPPSREADYCQDGNPCNTRIPPAIPEAHQTNNSTTRMQHTALHSPWGVQSTQLQQHSSTAVTEETMIKMKLQCTAVCSTQKQRHAAIAQLRFKKGGPLFVYKLVPCQLPKAKCFLYDNTPSVLNS